MNFHVTMTDRLQKIEHMASACRRDMLAPMKIQQCSELQITSDAFEADVHKFAEAFSATSATALPFRDVTTFDVSDAFVQHSTHVPLTTYAF